MIKVLIIDDEPLVANVCKNIFESCPVLFEVVGVAQNGNEGVKLARKFKPDIVITDYFMPDIDGGETTRRILAETKGTKVVIISGYLSATDKVEGATEIVPKPFEAEALILAVLNAYVGKKSNRDAPLRSARPSPKKAIGTKLVSQVLAEIVGSFCHDLGNDLAGACWTLRSPEGAKATHRAETFLSTAITSLQDLHQFVRTFYGDDSSTLAVVSADQVENELRAMVSAVISKAGVEVRVLPSGIRTRLVMPRILLRHLVVPLVANSIEAFAQQNSKTKDVVTVEIGWAEAHEELEVVVSDTGPGWTHTVRDIEQSVRRGKTFSQKGKGRGHGLQNIYRIVRKLGGQVFFDSTSAGGACVRIRIPWSEKDA